MKDKWIENEERITSQTDTGDHLSEVPEEDYMRKERNLHTSTKDI